MIANEKDIFDMLGIGGREDSYTDLLKSAFDASEEFRKKFCSFFETEFAEDVNLLIRPAVFIDIGPRKKEMPDMVLSSKKTKKVVLIENKIFSGEGYEQTKRYCDDAFVKRFNEYLGIENAENSFYFVTLTGIAASANTETGKTWRNVKWSDLIRQCCRNCNFENENLKVLMKNVLDRAMHFDDIAVPKDEELLWGYLERAAKWVTYDLLLEKVFDTVLGALTHELNSPSLLRSGCSWTTGGYAPGYYLVQIFKEHWCGKTFDDCLVASDAKKCFDLHYEFQCRPYDEKAFIYIHYHTNPYFTGGEINALCEKGKKELIQAALDVKTKIIFDARDNKVFGEGWQYPRQIKNTALFICWRQIQFNAKTTVLEFKSQIAGAIKQTHKKIDETVAAINAEHEN